MWVAGRDEQLGFVAMAATIVRYERRQHWIFSSSQQWRSCSSSASVVTLLEMDPKRRNRKHREKDGEKEGRKVAAAAATKKKKLFSLPWTALRIQAHEAAQILQAMLNHGCAVIVLDYGELFVDVLAFLEPVHSRSDRKKSAGEPSGEGIYPGKDTLATFDVPTSTSTDEEIIKEHPTTFDAPPPACKLPAEGIHKVSIPDTDTTKALIVDENAAASTVDECKAKLVEPSADKSPVVDDEQNVGLLESATSKHGAAAFIRQRKIKRAREDQEKQAKKRQKTLGKTISGGTCIIVQQHQDIFYLLCDGYLTYTQTVPKRQEKLAAEAKKWHTQSHEVKRKWLKKSLFKKDEKKIWSVTRGTYTGTSTNDWQGTKEAVDEIEEELKDTEITPTSFATRLTKLAKKPQNIESTSFFVAGYEKKKAVLYRIIKGVMEKEKDRVCLGMGGYAAEEALVKHKELPADPREILKETLKDAIKKNEKTCGGVCTMLRLSQHPLPDPDATKAFKDVTVYDN